MHASALLLSLLAPLVAAIPAADASPTPTPTVPAAPVSARPHHIDPTAVWITVDKSGRPSSVTPIATTISGEATFVDAAPNELTGTVFTITDRRNARVTTSTGEPPLPTARNKQGQGAFAPCHNANGKGAPFCSPEENDEVVVGKTYYLTWDSTFPMLKSNSTRKLKLRLVGNFVNETGDLGEEIVNHNFLKPALHGFFPWNVGKNTVPKDAEFGTIRLRLQRLFVDEDGEEEPLEHDIPGPQVRTVRPPPHDTGLDHGGIPAGAELYIALPSVFGALGLVMVGSLIWARNRRKMRFGISGSGGSPAKGSRSARLGRAQRMLNKMKKKRVDRDGGDGEQGMQLLERDLREYDDEDDDEGHFAGQEGWGPAAQRRHSKEGYKES